MVEEDSEFGMSGSDVANAVRVLWGVDHDRHANLRGGVPQPIEVGFDKEAAAPFTKEADPHADDLRASLEACDQFDGFWIWFLGQREDRHHRESLRILSNVVH